MRAWFVRVKLKGGMMFRVSRPISLVIVVYWFAFWLLNALDKVLARQDLGLIQWWGNDRVEKFTGYFDRLDLGAGLVKPTLYVCGLVEFGAAVLFALAASAIYKSSASASAHTRQAIALSIVIFLGFSVFDVIVGDRAELLEHGTYIGVLLISYIAVAAESFFDHLAKDKAGLKDETGPASPA